jgi:hypothetical protein
VAGLAPVRMGGVFQHAWAGCDWRESEPNGDMLSRIAHLNIGNLKPPMARDRAEFADFYRVWGPLERGYILGVPRGHRR